MVTTASAKIGQSKRNVWESVSATTNGCGSNVLNSVDICRLRVLVMGVDNGGRKFHEMANKSARHLKLPPEILQRKRRNCESGNRHYCGTLGINGQANNYRLLQLLRAHVQDSNDPAWEKRQGATSVVTRSH
jgi:hypothetical protein